ncbi:MAG: ACT domain-containing protein, partial [Clostridia bacterium]|nr:ACT domain-containing protein [Clostridia bacterium]
LPKNGTLKKELQALPSDIRAKPAWGRTTQGIRVRGIDNILIRFANCCNPVPGDPIGGYISRGRGVTVHRLDCGNMEALTHKESSRMVEVAWDEDFAAPFQAKLKIETMDRSGMLNDILNVLSELKINVNSINAKTHSNTANIEILLFVKTREQLDYIVEKISHIKDVFGVRRTSQRMSKLN